MIWEGHGRSVRVMNDLISVMNDLISVMNNFSHVEFSRIKQLYGESQVILQLQMTSMFFLFDLMYST